VKVINTEFFILHPFLFKLIATEGEVFEDYRSRHFGRDYAMKLITEHVIAQRSGNGEKRTENALSGSGAGSGCHKNRLER